jgi:hypothetical protein
LEEAAEAKLSAHGLADWSELDALEQRLWSGLEDGLWKEFGVTAAP